MKYVLTIDVGGTHFSLAVVDSKGNMYPSNPVIKDLSRDMAKEEILGALSKEITKLLKDYTDYTIHAIGVGFPNPFDYKKGVVTGGRKFKNLEGADIKNTIQNSIDVPVFFENDAHTFLLGENWLGAAKNSNRAMGVTMGAGLGAAFLVDGKIVTSGDGVPEEGEIWSIPFKESILEDYISKRGLEVMYKDRYSDMEIERFAQMAFGGDKYAKKVFADWGNTISEGLHPLVESFNPEVVVFGGQISKSLELFMPKFTDNVKIKKSVLGDRASLYGAASLALKNENT